MKMRFLIKLIIKIVALVCLASIVVFPMTGCPANDKPQHLAVVYAACQNNPSISVGGQLYDAITETTDHFNSTMSVFVADSSCYRSFYGRFSAPNKQLSDSRMKQIKKNYTRMALNAISEAKAQADEVDLMGTISQSSRQLLSDRKDNEETTMIIIASGLSTTAPLDFTCGYLNCTPDEVVNALKERDCLPDLSFVNKIIWVGCGDVTAPQEKPSASDIKNLKAIWKGILEESGCKNVTFAPDLTEKESSHSEYAVKTVEVNGELPDPLKIHYMSSIEFRSFTTEIVTAPEEVKNTISPYADYLKLHRNRCILLAGMTDHYGNNDRNNLLFSLKRADAIKKVFVDDFNIDPAQIITCGLGYTDHPWRFRDDNGNELHSANRSTIIIDADTEEAKHLLSIGIRE